MSWTGSQKHLIMPRLFRTFLISKSPRNEVGFPGSCTGKREYPLNNLELINKLVQLHLNNWLHHIYSFVIHDRIRTQTDNILELP